MRRPEPPLPCDESLYEFVDGRWIETTPSSPCAGLIWTRLASYLGAHILRQDPCPGELAIQALFRIPRTDDPTRKLRPDVAFVSSERWPTDRPISPTEDAWDVVPDLTVKVVGPTEPTVDLLGRVKEYFEAGVRLVWVVSPIRRCIHVYEAWNRIRVVTETDDLDGGEVLPGFRRSLDRLFGPVEPENGKPS
jgi:Uma2 family endonuclease